MAFFENSLKRFRAAASPASITSTPSGIGKSGNARYLSGGVGALITVGVFAGARHP